MGGVSEDPDQLLLTATHTKKRRKGTKKNSVTKLGHDRAARVFDLLAVCHLYSTIAPDNDEGIRSSNLSCLSVRSNLIGASEARSMVFARA